MLPLHSPGRRRRSACWRSPSPRNCCPRRCGPAIALGAAMTMHAYWRHLPSNELWAVTLQRGAIVGACGPLNEVDMTGGVLRHLPYSVPLGAWVNQNRPHFEPASAPEPMPTPERPDDIEHALMQGETCLR